MSKTKRELSPMSRQDWRNSISTAMLVSWLISTILQPVISSPLTRPFCANTTSSVIRIRRNCLRRRGKKTDEARPYRAEGRGLNSERELWDVIERDRARKKVKSSVHRFDEFGRFVS